MLSCRTAIILVFALGLAGCGFRPLYGTGGSLAQSELAAIEVAPIPDRLGQVLRHDLLDRLTPFGEPERPRYRLEVTLSERSRELAIQQNSEVTRVNLRLSATFSLVEVNSGNEVFHGVTRSIGSYNVIDSDYANVVAANDTARRAAREISENIRIQIAVFLAER